MHSVSLISQQKEVQRKLGRNMLLLQQYELTLKALLPAISRAGTPETFDSNHNSKIANIQKKTLGQLVGEFLANVVITEEKCRASIDEDAGEIDEELTQPYFRFRLQILLSDKELQLLSDALAGLIELRNELTHHFLAHFDLQTVDSCSTAETYLDDAYNVFKIHLDHLRGWCESIQQAHNKAKEGIASPEFEQWVKHGICPDGSIVWPYSSIVRSLLRTWKDLNQDGWTMLDDAIATIKSREPRV